MGEFLSLVGYSRPVYKKCGLCSRVKDCHYRMDVRSAESSSMLVGSLDLCKTCAQNMGEIIRKQEVKVGVIETNLGSSWRSGNCDFADNADRVQVRWTY